MIHSRFITLILCLLLSAVQAAPPTATPTSEMAVAANVVTVPWKVSGCLGAWHINNVTTSGGNVSQWSDLSGNNNPLVQAGAGFQFAFAADGAQPPSDPVSAPYNGYYDLTTPITLNYRDFTVIFIGRCNRDYTARSNVGCLFEIGSGGPSARWNAWNTTLTAPTSYAPTMVTKLMGLSSYVLSGGSSEARSVVNGSVTRKGAFNAGSGTLRKIFTDYAGTAIGPRHPMTAMLVYNRALETPEIAAILAYFGADIPSKKVFYPIGDSISNSTGATTIQNGFPFRVAAAIGADVAFYAVNGQTLSTINGVSSAEIQPHVGAENIYHVFGGTNDNAASPSQSAAIIANRSAICTKIRTAVPSSRIIVATELPRNANFQGGQDAANFESTRQTDCTSVRNNYPTYADAIADYAANSTIGDQADADSTTYYGDKIHPTDAGCAIMAPISIQAYYNIRGFGAPGAASSVYLSSISGNTMLHTGARTGSPQTWNYNLQTDANGDLYLNTANSQIATFIQGSLAGQFTSSGLILQGGLTSLYQKFGSGSPEGVVTAPVGAVYHRTNGGAGTAFYVKESGTGNTGWVAK